MAGAQRVINRHRSRKTVAYGGPRIQVCRDLDGTGHRRRAHSANSQLQGTYALSRCDRAVDGWISHDLLPSSGHEKVVFIHREVPGARVVGGAVFLEDEKSATLNGDISGYARRLHAALRKLAR